MQWNANIRENNRIFEELGLSGLASILSSLPTKKAISKGEVQAPRGRAPAIMLGGVKGLIYQIISLKLRSLMMELTIQTYKRRRHP